MDDVDDVLRPVARSGVLWNVLLRSDVTTGMGHGLPRSVPFLVLAFLRFISATLAYTMGPVLSGEAGGGVAAPESVPDWKRELVIMVE